MTIFHGKKIALTVIIIAVFVLLPLPTFAAPSAQNQTANFSKVFGGKILFAVPCTCSGNYLLTIGPPRPATIIFQPGVSTSYLFHQAYKVGSWVLGNYSSGGSCYVYAGITCIYLPNSGTITKIGTSR